MGLDFCHLLIDLSFVTDTQTLKILEDLQNKKQALKKQTQQNESPSEHPSSSYMGISGKEGASFLERPPSMISVQSTGSTTSQRERTALQHALQNSFGFFVSQDSSFGNLVLPVLPRF
jgi:hypothetical protein